MAPSALDAVAGTLHNQHAPAITPYKRRSAVRHVWKPAFRPFLLFTLGCALLALPPSPSMAEELVCPTYLGKSYAGDLVIPPGCTATLAGTSVVAGNLDVHGTLTHPATQLKSEAIHLTVVGKVHVHATGKIDANEKSTKDGAAGTYDMSHGGVASRSYSSSEPYGSMEHPTVRSIF